MTLGAVANAELNCEVCSQPDKKDGKRNRNGIERADQQQAERGCYYEADKDGYNNSEHNADGAQCQP